jgi:hypothetical protein
MDASVPLNRIIEAGAHQGAAAIDDIGQIWRSLKLD